MYEIYDADPSLMSMLAEQAAARRARHAVSAARPRVNIRRIIGNFIFGGTVVVSAASAALFVPIFLGK